MENSNDNMRKPSWWAILIPLAVLVSGLFLVISFFGADALGGASQVALLLSCGVTCAIAMIFYKVPWRVLEASMGANINSIATAILILLLIGAVSGSWMISGVVPTLICYGMKIISPKVFLFATCVICALVSLMTGSSWTTIATLGVAFVGIGTAQGYSPGWIAGAIISGAYFGDKISPLSDTTVLASSVSGTGLFEHIRYMMITTVPSVTIALVVYLIVSLCHTPEAVISQQEFELSLKSAFHISPWLLIVPLLTCVMVAKKLPAIITLFASAFVAGIVALVSQPEIISAISTGNAPAALCFKDAFRGLFITWFGDTSVDTGNEMLNNLVSTRGMRGMLDTIFLIVCAAAFGGVLVGSGMIQSLTERLTKRVDSRTGVVSSTVVSGLAANMMTGDQYLSIILTCSLYKKLYADKGYENRLLSRSVEDSATVTSVLIPWNSCGMTQSTVLKIPTLDYLPYCFFNLISPLMSITVAMIGYKIVRHK